ncbi:hypothetical protein RJT34_02590 [Clitoria ternatea]|uniref:Cytosol aminopeptidase domain-containing protein n=1 Tax=Clitoria ternatea TaxID=43366 RepID=A0AAN9PZ27_CLITE
MLPISNQIRVVSSDWRWWFRGQSHWQVNNTDAEGRLTLADALVYTCNQGVEKHLVAFDSQPLQWKICKSFGNNSNKVLDVQFGISSASLKMFAYRMEGKHISDCDIKRHDQRKFVIIVVFTVKVLGLIRDMCSVVVLESRDRIGGRIYTDYSFGFLVDLGASWLHGVSSENLLASLIGSYELFDTDGKQVPQELVTKVGQIFETILQEAMIDEMQALKHNGTWELVPLPPGKKTVGCRLEGLAHKVIQWYLCRMKGWFAADSDTFSLKGWDQVAPCSERNNL